jgi:uncharacterized protein (DUF1684 family)
MRSAISVCASIVLLAAAPPASYQASIQAWREGREQGLKTDDGWLTVAGLFWLKPGANTAGSDPAADIVLPEGRAPASLGVFTFEHPKVTFRAAPGVHVLINGKPAPSAELASDASGHPDLIRIGDFTMFVIERGGRYAIRLKDVNSAYRRAFTGLRWYPVKPEYRVTAKWNPFDHPRRIAIPNVLGQTEFEPSTGYASFQLHGHEYQLEPIVEGNQLFFIFRDGTSGKTTYGAGRFLYANTPREGKLVLDFNKAYNPPCAFTPYATCPLPPKQNRLSVKIEAGELQYGNHPAPKH